MEMRYCLSEEEKNGQATEVLSRDDFGTPTVVIPLPLSPYLSTVVLIHHSLSLPLLNIHTPLTCSSLTALTTIPALPPHPRSFTHRVYTV